MSNLRLSRPAKLWNKQTLIVVGLVVVIGIVTLILVHAATNGSAVEAEGANTSGNVSTVADSNASGGSALKFGVAGATVTGNPLGSSTRSGLPWFSGSSNWGNNYNDPQTMLDAEHLWEQTSGFLEDSLGGGAWAFNLGDLGAPLTYSTMPKNVPIMIDQPPFPEDTGGAPGTWSQAAAGAYDSAYQQMGSYLAGIVNQRGGTPVVVRLAWELNGGWYQHSACAGGNRDPAPVIAGWRRAYTNIKAGAGANNNKVLIDWSIASLDHCFIDGIGELIGDPLTNLWPGKNYVDLIGVDFYDYSDGWTGSAPATNGNFPPATFLNRLMDFAKANGEWMGIDEWGLSNKVPSPTCNVGTQGGDNPAFITGMYSWIRAQVAAHNPFSFENYFNDPESCNVNSMIFPYPGFSGGVPNPNSAARYKQEHHN